MLNESGGSTLGVFNLDGDDYSRDVRPLRGQGLNVVAEATYIENAMGPGWIKSRTQKAAGLIPRNRGRAPVNRVALQWAMPRHRI